MKATIILLARDRTTAWEHGVAAVYGIAGISSIKNYDSSAIIPLHETCDYNILLAEIRATCMFKKNGSLSRCMAAGDLVVFDTGYVFLADVPDKWTLLDPERAEPFKLLANNLTTPTKGDHS